MRKIKYTLALVFLLSNLAIAQATLVKTNGDTLVGRLTYGVDSFKKEYVIIKANRKKTRLKVLEIRSIKTAKGETIRPVGFDGGYKLAKEIVPGFMTYYKVSDPKSSERYTADLLHKMDGTYVLFEGKIGFRSRTKDFLQDCANIANAVSARKYRIGDLENLTRDYNVCIESKDYSNPVSQPLAETEKKALSKSLEQKLADFATLLQYSDKISAKADVTAMFNDVSGKLRRKETVPSYLKTALTNALKTDPQLTKLLNEILGSK